MVVEYIDYLFETQGSHDSWNIVVDIPFQLLQINGLSDFSCHLVVRSITMAIFPDAEALNFPEDVHSFDIPQVRLTTAIRFIVVRPGCFPPW